MIKAKLAAPWPRRAWQGKRRDLGLGAGTVALLLAVSILASGCSSSSDEPPPAASTGDSSASSTSTTGNESFPNLGTVPDQPPPATSPAQRQAIMDGLIADRKNAVYSDQPLSGQPSSSVAPPEAPQPITPEGGGTTLSPTLAPPPADSGGDQGNGGDTSPPRSDSGPDMPATPQAPVSSQPLPEAAPAPEPTTQPESVAPPPQSNAAPLAPGDVQYADASGITPAVTIRHDDVEADPTGLSEKTQLGAKVTKGGAEPQNLLPQGPFAYMKTKPRAATEPADTGSVTVDLGVIGNAPQRIAPLQPVLQRATSLSPVYVDLGVLGDAPASVMPQQAGYQTAVYQSPVDQSSVDQSLVDQSGANQLAIYQVRPRSDVTVMAAGAIPLPPAGQPLGLIYFANGSTHLNAEAREVLLDLARIYVAQGGSVLVVGHASSVPGGDSPVNARLSYARAQAVARYLGAHGVNISGLEMRGVGIVQPVFYETARNGSAGNRRADIFLTP
jgi:outer membrane protein OmpA-like peptidoglycan-associated protein